jgi:hypothetical protein
MFALRSVDLAGRIVGCADGPASFNAELTARGGCVVSADPLYRFSADEIRSRITDACDRVVANTREHLDAYRWDEIPSLDALIDLRMAAMNRFLTDYVDGLAHGRYVPEELPRLSFDDDSFDIALCSHFLFLYPEQLTLQFHVEAILEMARLAPDVRIFPLVDFNGRPSSHVPATVDALKYRGMRAEIVQVAYEFQRGANEMLRISRRE